MGFAIPGIYVCIVVLLLFCAMRSKQKNYSAGSIQKMIHKGMHNLVIGINISNTNFKGILSSLTSSRGWRLQGFE
jgi:hypothetical protein